MRRHLTLILSVALPITGCSHHIGYAPDDGRIETVRHEVPIHVVVVPLTDARPEQERKRLFKLLRHWDKTHDEAWEDKDIALALTRVLAMHLRQAGVFAEVEVDPTPCGDLDDQTLARLRKAGHDAVLVGTIEHFEGVRNQDLLRQLGLLAVPVPGIDAAIGHEAEGHVVFRPVALRRTSDGATVWQGEASCDDRSTARLPGTPEGEANEALCEALNRLARALDADSARIGEGFGRKRVERPVPHRQEDPSFLEEEGKTLLKGVDDLTKPPRDLLNGLIQPIEGLF